MALFNVGAVLVNFGHLVQVLAVDAERGLLVRGLAGQGFGRRPNFFADPAKCTLAPAEAQRALPRLSARERAVVARLQAEAR